MLLESHKALNKAFLKIKPNRAEIELFKQNLILLLDSSKEINYNKRFCKIINYNFI